MVPTNTPAQKLPKLREEQSWSFFEVNDFVTPIAEIIKKVTCQIRIISGVGNLYALLQTLFWYS